MDHEILKTALAQVVKCKSTLELAYRIIDGSNPQDEVILYFPGDDLFTPIERKRGLPLGNQTSQFFANVYLNPLDQFIERQLKPAQYVRYVDDFILFGDDKRVIADMLRPIGQFLCVAASSKMNQNVAAGARPASVQVDLHECASGEVLRPRLDLVVQG